MADLVIKKRPVVLRLAELQKYPTLDDRYAATLPFNGGAVKCFCLSEWVVRKCPCIPTPSVRAKCIKRTGERWAWFSSARDLDNTYGERLGTLHYLPWEIRQIIIEMLLIGGSSYRGFAVARGLTVNGVLDPFTMYQDDYDSPYGLWHASPSTRSEMEHYYLSNTEFIFKNPEELIIVADQLSPFQWSLLRLVTLEVQTSQQYNSSLEVRMSPCLKDWLLACARLPPNLASINFDVSDYTIHFDVSDYSLLGTEIHGHWFLVEPEFDLTIESRVHRTIIFINTLGKLAHRVAARAKIGLGGGCIVSDEPTYLHYWVLDDVEPWSKNFLSWWEEKTKIDFEGDETYNKAA